MPARAFRCAIAVACALSLAASVALASSEESSALSLVPLDSIKTGGAEIGAHDPQTQRLFVTNAAASTVSILSTRNPSRLVNVGTIDTSPFGSPNSVAVSNGIVAVAIEAKIKTDAGRVGFYKANGELLATVKVGALPDMVTFTPDGEYLLVANEGEPSGYGPGYADPEGSVSIIRIPSQANQVRKLKDADVRTAGFGRFNGQEAALRADGIRIYGPGANAAMDFEPEYIGVSPDSRKAYVTLQENNAVAVIDIASAYVTHLLPLGYKDQNRAPYTVATYEWAIEDLPAIGKTKAGQTLRLGGFSGLAFEGVTADGKLKFISNTDRGPNGEPNAAAQRPFLLPQFSPRLVRFTLDPATGKFDLIEQILLRNADGAPLTGLPNTKLAGTTDTPYNDEIPIDLFGSTVPLDPLGGDFEGIVVAEDGTFWLPDEYRPAIYHFKANGRLIERFIPFGTHAAAGLPVPAPGTAGPFGIEALPAVIAQRRQNRGMEAIAIKDGKIYAFVQSPIRNPPSLANGALNAMRNVRVVEFDPKTRATRQFLYTMDNPAPLSSSDTRADKIGDAVAVPGGGFLVLERDDDSVPASPIENITKKIYAFDLKDATDIATLDVLYAGRSLDQMTADELAAVGVKPIKKTLHVDLATAGFAGVQKIEGLAVLDDGRLAVVNDNDFTVAQIVIDNAIGTFTRAPTYHPESETLGLISVPGLDASDRDSAINIRAWPVRGLYSPDALATFTAKGQSYFVTANEGDARDWPGLTEEVRIGALKLDPVAFPNATSLQQNANLGRLNVTRTLGDANGDSVYDSLFTLGGRSFSIWTTNGSLVFDSDADLERITAATYPENFNASNDNNNFDDRSDNKGPEPEGLALGTIEGRRYAFIGLERTGGIAAYDITTPSSPVFVDYVNNRDFSVSDLASPDAGDLGPEGVLFIPADESPTRQPLLVVSNEISGTVTTYALEVCSRKHSWGSRRGFGAGWKHWFQWPNRCYR
jgi:DNA-binding beta-propeller fold protein YncE